jgi:SAM-dependent methyltransferase
MEFDLGKISAQEIKERLKEEAKRSRDSIPEMTQEKRSLPYTILKKIHNVLLRSKLYRALYENYLINLKDSFLSEKGVDLSSLMEYEGEKFVKNGYIKILGREPDEEGLKFYLSSLKRGELRKIEFLGALRYSHEGRRRAIPVRNLYVRYMVNRLSRVRILGFFVSLVLFVRRVNRILREFEALRFSIFSLMEEMEMSLREDFRNTLRIAIEKLSRGKHAVLLPDDFYIAFEGKFRGTQDELKEKFSVYLPFIEEIMSQKKKVRALDLGCGRGEWLTIIKKLGVEGVGVDSNSRAVEECVNKGLNVKNEDAISYLLNCAPSSFDIITGFHLIEHLPFDTITILLDEVKRVLRDGGLFILETPNPTNILVSSYDFYLDPSHIRPVHPLLLKFLALFKGFLDPRVYFIEKKDNSYILTKAEDWQLNTIDDYVRAPRDFCLIVRR